MLTNNNKTKIYTIKRGNVVPENAVNLAFYYNYEPSDDKELVLISQAPKNTIDHKVVRQYLRKTGLPKIDDKYFPTSLFYSDNDGYSGILKRINIDWEKVSHIESKFFSVAREYTVTQQSVPQSIDYKEGQYEGKLYLSKVNYTPTKFREEPIYGTQSKEFEREMKVENLTSPSYNFPDHYPTQINEDGYVGYIPKVQNGVEYIPHNDVDENTTTTTTTKTYTQTYKFTKNIWNSSQQKLTPPQTITKNIDGKNVTMTFKRIKAVRLSPLKYDYGYARYFGYGDELCGSNDYRYSVSTTSGGKTYTGKCKFDDSVPPSTMGVYGRLYNNYVDMDFYLDDETKNAASKEPLRKSGMDISGLKKFYFDINRGELWTFDYDNAKFYAKAIFKSDDIANLAYKRGGIWLKNFYSYYGTVVPRILGSTAYSDKDASGVKTDTNRVWTRRYTSPNNYDLTDTSTHPTKWSSSKQTEVYNTVDDILGWLANVDPYYNTLGITATGKKVQLGVDNYYFKDFMVFYKFYEVYVDVEYEYTTTTTTTTYTSTTTWTGIQKYKGTLTKTIQTGVNKIPIEWKADCEYANTLSYTWYDYNGQATYQGVASKRIGIGNIDPEGLQKIMFPDNNGILKDLANNKDFENELFEITNIFKDNVALPYRYKLKNKIMSDGYVDEYGYYQGKGIKLIDQNNNEIDNTDYKYLIKFEGNDPTNSNTVCDVYIYTNVPANPNNDIYCVYNSINNNEIIPGVVEKIYPQPFFEKNVNYEVLNVNNNVLKTNIKVKDYTTIKDTRNKINFKYKVKATVDGVEYISTPVSASAINKEYALPHEISLFKNRSMIISPKENDRYLTAYEFIIKSNNIINDSEKEKLKKAIYSIIIDNDTESESNKGKLNVYTNPNGTGKIYVETTEDTGFLDSETNTYTKKINIPFIYKVVGDTIYPGYFVRCKDVKEIKVLPPFEKDLLLNWYPRVQYSYFTQVSQYKGHPAKIIYTIPEYKTQNFSNTYKYPYIDIAQEKATILNSSLIKVKNYPLYVKLNINNEPINLKVYKINIDGTKNYLNIKGWYYLDGIIEIDDYISDNDEIKVDYTYELSNYTYRGYIENEKLIDLDLNPNQYHTLIDNRTTELKRIKVYDIMNSNIYFYLKPAKVIKAIDFNPEYELDFDNLKYKNASSGTPDPKFEIITNAATLYHRIENDKPLDDEDLFIGKAYINSFASLKSTIVIDTRTRGGGLLYEISESLRKELEPESDYYFDIGYWDGEPYSENAVIIIRLDKRILKEYGGRFTYNDVNNAINKWLAAGVLPIIEYVDTFSKYEMPQYTMHIEENIINKTDITPIVFSEVVDN